MSYLVAEYIRAVSGRGTLGDTGPDYPIVIAKEVLTVSATPLSGSSRGTVPAGCNLVLFSVFGDSAYGVGVLVGADATIASQAAAKTDASKILTSSQLSYPQRCAPGDRISAVDVSLP